ncbi:hypothetical protein [Ramlibacter montanisoli]|uniref:Uncharacterized protein n=1 Tax=Ramlibacter montanisoli TaxID=2732512 RepID=A0A849KJE8_9BURK|nr:hypothetical protein [Ramlibacter montanisoli]NNU44153.1 hypothetical protein [Ramlibacter montanisoli]
MEIETKLRPRIAVLPIGVWGISGHGVPLEPATFSSAVASRSWCSREGAFSMSPISLVTSRGQENRNGANRSAKRSRATSSPSASAMWTLGACTSAA